MRCKTGISESTISILVFASFALDYTRLIRIYIARMLSTIF